MDIDRLDVLSIPDAVTGEVLQFRRVASGYEQVIDPLVYAAARWRMKYVVRSLLGYKSRQAKCHRWRRPDVNLGVYRSVQHDQAFFGGLETCSSVWLCPLCAAKISERRRVELQTAIDNARASGLWVQMLTLTVPHGLGDDLCDILDKMGVAWTKYMMSSRSGQRLRSQLSLVGHIRCLEVTYGDAGWHPHYHVLLFVAPGTLSLDEQEFIWVSSWQTAAVSAGLPLPSVLANTLRNGDAAASYVSKWGLSHEMTKQHLKKGKKGATPWDLLRILTDETWDGMPDLSKKSCSALWLNYARAFKGRRQLVWSKGLKDLLGVRIISDEEAATADIDNAVLLSLISDTDWSWILAARAEVEILSVARDCPDALSSYISSLRSRVNPFQIQVDEEELCLLFGGINDSASFSIF